MNLTSYASLRLVFNGCLAVIALAALPAVGRAQQASLEWELVNPFRFIQNQELIDELKEVARQNPSAAGLEGALQNISVADVKRRRAQATNCNSPSPEEKRKCFEPFAGWFAKVAENDYRNTCWDPSNHKYRTDNRCADYIDPRSHRVRVWVTNPEGLGDIDPQWTVQPAPEQHHTGCATKYQHRFCIEFDVKYAETPIEVNVSAQFPGITLTLNSPIKVRDLLIVGLGDSYASGEGNPDIPATFVNSDRHTDWFAEHVGKHEGAEYPRKERDAVWLDQRCHRSMYSYQFKTALQLALKHPQQAVTFVSFSCSGAETRDIIKHGQSPKEGTGNPDPQLKALAETLKGSKRQIDYLLLSTGGNDIKFSWYVAYILIPRELLGKLFGRFIETQIKKSFDESKFEKLLLGEDGESGNYGKVQEAFLKTPLIRDCTLSKCTHVLLTPYPKVLTDEHGDECRAVRGEFDEFFRADERASRIQSINKFVVGQIRDVQSQVPARLQWTLVEGNVERYRGHGFCAQDTQSSAFGEIFKVPTWDEQNNKWDPFPPRDYQAYESRSRWFRLPVDSVLTTDQTDPHKPTNILEFARSNIMHPTAQGLANTADLNVEIIEAMERSP